MSAKTTLFAYPLDRWDINEVILLRFFKPFGAIKADIPKDKDGGNRGYGFIHFHTRQEAQYAINTMNGYSLGNKKLQLSFKGERHRDKQWTSVQYPPVLSSIHPVTINRNEFVVIPTTKLEYIYQFNAHNNKWSKWFKYPDGFEISFNPVSACCDTFNQLLYIIDLSFYTFVILIINTSNLNYEIYKVSDSKMLESTTMNKIIKSMVIHGKLNMIIEALNADKTTRLIWDYNTQKVTAINMKSIMRNSYLLHVPSKQKIFSWSVATLLLYNHNNYIYDIVNNKWEAVECKSMPNIGNYHHEREICEYRGFECILSCDEKNMIMFGGQILGYPLIDCGGDECPDDFWDDYISWIYVWNLDKMSYIKSKIKCPSRGQFDAVVVDGDMNDKILICGFIRNRINKRVLPLTDIINLISMWYGEQYIHLLHHKTCKHWKMCVKRILVSKCLQHGRGCNGNRRGCKRRKY